MCRILGEFCALQVSYISEDDLNMRIGGSSGRHPFLFDDSSILVQIEPMPQVSLWPPGGEISFARKTGARKNNLWIGKMENSIPRGHRRIFEKCGHRIITN
jgi:hypothetical protein